MSENGILSHNDIDWKNGTSLAFTLIDAYSHFMKELLDLLEERVTSLVEETDALRQKNTQLQQDLAEKTGSLAEENSALREALAQERTAREAAASRIDALLQRLTKHLPE